MFYNMWKYCGLRKDIGAEIETFRGGQGKAGIDCHIFDSHVADVLTVRKAFNDTICPILRRRKLIWSQYDVLQCETERGRPSPINCKHHEATGNQSMRKVVYEQRIVPRIGSEAVQLAGCPKQSA